MALGGDSNSRPFLLSTCQASCGQPARWGGREQCPGPEREVSDGTRGPEDLRCLAHTEREMLRPSGSACLCPHREGDPAVDGQGPGSGPGPWGPGCWAPRRRFTDTEGSAVRDELRCLGLHVPSHWTHGLLSIPGHRAQAGLPHCCDLLGQGLDLRGSA